jgi:hypothetical protein
MTCNDYVLCRDCEEVNDALFASGDGGYVHDPSHPMIKHRK